MKHLDAKIGDTPGLRSPRHSLNNRRRVPQFSDRPYFYLFLLCLLAVILYLDRVCLSVAGPRMQDSLRIPPYLWGWVGTVFSLGYGLFEIPAGHWADRAGARRILTRIVLWWSVFTALTGAVVGYPMLLLVRFLFGAGEAGALPIGAVAIAQWFPPEKRGRAFGLFIMSSQLGGALSPLLVVPIQRRYGWPMSFYVFAVVGVLWSLVWFARFRDRQLNTPARVFAGGRTLLRHRGLWAIMGLTACYVYTMSFYQTWLHTYLEKGRGFAENELLWSSLPYFLGAGANLLGGFMVDWWSCRGVGRLGLLWAAVMLSSAMAAQSHTAIIAFLSLAYMGITFQQGAVFAACTAIGGVRSGVVTAMMNTAGQVGYAISASSFGYLVAWQHHYNAPLAPMCALLGIGSLLWNFVNISALCDTGKETKS